jgi:hypothetical protein
MSTDMQRRSGESLRRHGPVQDRLTTRVSVTLKDGSTREKTVAHPRAPTTGLTHADMRSTTPAR